jgi:hypothetical protein
VAEKLRKRLRDAITISTVQHASSHFSVTCNQTVILQILNPLQQHHWMIAYQKLDPFHFTGVSWKEITDEDARHL